MWTQEQIIEQTLQVFRDNGITEGLPTIFFKEMQGSYAKLKNNEIHHAIWMTTGLYRECEEVPARLVNDANLRYTAIHEACHILHYMRHPEILNQRGSTMHGSEFKAIEIKELSRYAIRAEYARAYAKQLIDTETGEILYSRDEDEIGTFIDQPKDSGVQGYLFSQSWTNHTRRDR